MSTRTFYGKYRGVVTDNRDPLMLARVRANVPDVLGQHQSGWALPCLPFSGDGHGMLVLPGVGAGVWMEFEQGDPDYPIWTGGWWGASTQLPAGALVPPYAKTMIATEGGNALVLDDTPGVGGITLETAGGQRLVLSATGVELDNGLGAKIVLQGPRTSLNDGALDVT